MLDEEEPNGKRLLYERKRTRLQPLRPHELRPMNRLVVAGVLVALLAIMVGGWYVMHPAEKSAGDRAAKEEEQKAE